MDVEIEAKLKVDSLDEVEAKLRDLGAEFVAEQRQIDQQFDDANSTMETTDQCLRLRWQEVKGESRYILTYKGPVQQSDVKKRREIEVEVEDGGAVEKILSVLGYEVKLVVEKTRSLWRYGGCEVGLDRLDELGSFVEIEGPDSQRIADVQESLGLSKLEHITGSYASMICAKLRGSSSGSVIADEQGRAF